MHTTLRLDRAFKFWTVRPNSGRLAALPLLVAFLLSSNSGARFLALPLLSLSPPLSLIKRHVSEVRPPPVLQRATAAATGMKGAHLPRSSGLTLRTGTRRGGNRRRAHARHPGRIETRAQLNESKRAYPKATIRRLPPCWPSFISRLERRRYCRWETAEREQVGGGTKLRDA